MRIVTYANPFKINRIPNWEELKKYPHLCISETLVQGLKQSYGRDSFSYICTVDRLCKSFYNEWLDEPSNDIRRFIRVSEIIADIKDDKIRKAMKFNQQSVIDALRFLIELGIDLKDLSTTELTKEQNEFVRIYSIIKRDDYWNMLEYMKDKDTEDIKFSFQDILNEEIFQAFEEEWKENKERDNARISPDFFQEPDYLILANKIKALKEEISSGGSEEFGGFGGDGLTRKRKDLRRLEHFDKVIKAFQDENNFKKIVFHGVHRITPIILRLIRHFESLNIEVIFMFNYTSKYKNVYKTWDRVYEWTGLKPERYEDLSTLVETDLGRVLGGFLEGDFEDNTQLGSTIDKFDNLTAFSNFVSDKYKFARRMTPKLKDGSINKSGILANMPEQFYAVNGKEINELLRVYFPDQFGEKHFLSYPIGQFILALYNMWDNDKKELTISEINLKECLVSGFWDREDKSTPVQIYDKVKLYFTNVDHLSDFIKRLEYLEVCLNGISKRQDESLLKKFSFFSITLEELKYFKEIILDLQEIGKQLFNMGDSGTVNIKDHYDKLVSEISKRTSQSGSITKAEREFVIRIKERLERTQALDVRGTIADVKETLHYYMSSKLENGIANWIVRDFEQIDGGVLISDTTRASYYHYAQVSDEKMKKKINDFLSWPLTEKMFKDKTNKDKEIIFTCFSEYKNFLRYSLFYGTYFLKKGIKLSYIEESEDEKQNPYFLLKMIGLDVKDTSVFKNNFSDPKYQESPLLDMDIKDSDIEDEELEMFSVCSYKYLLNKLLERNSYYQNPFQARYYYIILLTIKSWDQFQRGNSGSVEETVRRVNSSFMKLFPFYEKVDIYDIENKAISEIHRALNSKQTDKMGTRYRRRKVNFLIAQLYDEEGNSLKMFDNNIRKRDLIYYLVDPNLDEKSNTKARKKIEAEICQYCNQREACMSSFVEVKSVE